VHRSVGLDFRAELLQPGVFRFGLLEGRQPGIGVFPQRQKIFIRSQRPRPSDIGDGATEVLRFRAGCWGAAVLGPYDGFALGTLRGKTRWPGGAEHAQPCKVKTAGRMPALPARDAVVVRTWGAAVLRPYMTVQVQNCRRRLGRSGVARGNFVRCVLS
jgi:hypothetical protein